MARAIRQIAETGENNLLALATVQAGGLKHELSGKINTPVPRSESKTIRNKASHTSSKVSLLTDFAYS